MLDNPGPELPAGVQIVSFIWVINLLAPKGVCIVDEEKQVSISAKASIDTNSPKDDTLDLRPWPIPPVCGLFGLNRVPAL